MLEDVLFDLKGQESIVVFYHVSTVVHGVLVTRMLCMSTVAFLRMQTWVAAAAHLLRVSAPMCSVRSERRVESIFDFYHVSAAMDSVVISACIPDHVVDEHSCISRMQLVSVPSSFSCSSLLGIALLCTGWFFQFGTMLAKI